MTEEFKKVESILDALMEKPSDALKKDLSDNAFDLSAESNDDGANDLGAAEQVEDGKTAVSEKEDDEDVGADKNEANSAEDSPADKEAEEEASTNAKAKTDEEKTSDTPPTVVDESVSEQKKKKAAKTEEKRKKVKSSLFDDEASHSSEESEGGNANDEESNSLKDFLASDESKSEESSAEFSLEKKSQRRRKKIRLRRTTTNVGVIARRLEAEKEAEEDARLRKLGEAFVTKDRAVIEKHLDKTQREAPSISASSDSIDSEDSADIAKREKKIKRREEVKMGLREDGSADSSSEEEGESDASIHSSNDDFSDDEIERIGDDADSSDEDDPMDDDAVVVHKIDLVKTLAAGRITGLLAKCYGLDADKAAIATEFSDALMTALTSATPMYGHTSTAQKAMETVDATLSDFNKALMRENLAAVQKAVRANFGKNPMTMASISLMFFAMLEYQIDFIENVKAARGGVCALSLLPYDKGDLINIVVLCRHNKAASAEGLETHYLPVVHSSPQHALNRFTPPFGTVKDPAVPVVEAADDAMSEVNDASDSVDEDEVMPDDSDSDMPSDEDSESTPALPAMKLIDRFADSDAIASVVSEKRYLKLNDAIALSYWLDLVKAAPEKVKSRLNSKKKPHSGFDKSGAPVVDKQFWRLGVHVAGFVDNGVFTLSDAKPSDGWTAYSTLLVDGFCLHIYCTHPSDAAHLSRINPVHLATLIDMVHTPERGPEVERLYSKNAAAVKYDSNPILTRAFEDMAYDDARLEKMSEYCVKSKYYAAISQYPIRLVSWLIDSTA